MSSKQELLLDLLKIKVRYSERDMIDVLNILQDEPQNEHLSKVLQLIAQLNNTPSKRGRGNTPKESKFDLLKESDPQHYTTLHDFQMKLINRQVLNEPRELKRLTAELGLKESTSRKRGQTIRLIIEVLAAMSPEEANQLIEQYSLRVEDNVSQFGLIADAILQRPADSNE
ncbi:hypothetical protein [Paenibacillus mesotrionivorans]|uniref:Uncharacterized protein n=1 Tax=Paenibacillus mesotrionivorans TaxID=3160968 RepID=A0ACC7NY43_9BACL